MQASLWYQKLFRVSTDPGKSWNLKSLQESPEKSWNLLILRLFLPVSIIKI